MRMQGSSHVLDARVLAAISGASLYSLVKFCPFPYQDTSSDDYAPSSLRQPHRHATGSIIPRLCTWVSLKLASVWHCMHLVTDSRGYLHQRDEYIPFEVKGMYLYPATWKGYTFALHLQDGWQLLTSFLFSTKCAHHDVALLCCSKPMAGSSRVQDSPHQGSACIKPRV